LNKSVIAVIVIGVAIAIAAGAFALVEPNTVSESETNPEPVEEIPEETKGRALTLEFHESVTAASSP